MSQPHAHEHPDADPCQFACARDTVLKTLQDQQDDLREEINYLKQMLETLMAQNGMELPKRRTCKPAPTHA